MLLLLLVPAASAEEPEWRTTWDGTLYGYANSTSLRGDSVLNPGNRIARLPQNSATAEGRFNLKAGNDTLRVTLRPVLLAQDNRNAFGSQRQNEAYLSQWQVRLRASEAWSVAAGREVLNWGPAQFRSPSSPFYFDNGRSNPMRELSGVDALKLSWTPDMERTLALVRITGSGHVAQDIRRNSWLLKADRRGGDWVGGLALAHTPGQGAFLGAHGQFTASDALLLYAEASSSSRAAALQSPADVALPFSIAARSPRRTDVLAGAAWTFDNGQSLNTEYLHTGHGYRAAEEGAYFARAAASPLWAGQALAYSPPLLGRDYLHLVWQSNLMETGGYWRAMATHSFTDNGNELSGYGEIALTGHVTAFALAILPMDGARQEFSSLLRRSVTAGLKIALP
ncbi:hypothetical protein FGKAn22_23870 [Ferrigenium kumadai]|uniref:Alginate export domain-containing protein n=1 Tax=Ferrigenium kumadai TaxID=1682490 RepID=A0AAN1T2E1_9PROT|nr:hypothetical protein [Ferrigenium kumadai]BBJ00695.1 hypothetical protein FGKAn22_23870 [Ferrigenium kumadai]